MGVALYILNDTEHDNLKYTHTHTEERVIHTQFKFEVLK